MQQKQDPVGVKLNALMKWTTEMAIVSGYMHVRDILICGVVESIDRRVQMSDVNYTDIPMLPASLKKLEPLLNTLGCKWSHRYINPSKPERQWVVIDLRSGKVGYYQVGMTEDEAVEAVLSMAVYRIINLEEKINKSSKNIENSLKELNSKS